MAALPTPPSDAGGAGGAGPASRLPWLRTQVDPSAAQPGRAQDRRAADVVATICAVGMVALVLATMPGFLAMHGSVVGESAALVVGAAFGYLSTGEHPMSRHDRWYLILGIWAAAAAGFGIAWWRDPSVSTLAGTWWTDMQYLVSAWGAGSTPPVPDLTGWPLLLAIGWGVGGFVWACLRGRRPLPAVAGVVALLVFEWEFLDDAAGRAFWPAVALGLLWLAAAWAYELAEHAWVGHPPSATRVVGLSAAGIALIMGIVALMPLNKPAIDLGALGYWIDSTFPALAHVEQGTRIIPAAGAGNGPARNPGRGGPLAPASPYTLKMMGFSSNDAALGGPLATSDRAALQVTVVSGSAPSVLYLQGAADDTYTGTGWTESKDSLYPAAPPRAAPPFTLGLSNPLPPRDAYTLRIQPVGVVTSSLFTALTPVAVQGASPVWDGLGNAWLGNPLPPSHSYEVSTIATQTPTSATTTVGFRGGISDPGIVAPCFGCGTAAETIGGGGPRLARAAFANDLQLPSSLPAAVGQLARAWTTGDTTPLAEALDIQNHLLQFPYTMDPPAPAAGTDFVDQFLFQIREGYCTYYSSAMAVMLRTLNIPTRWVTGFRVHTPAAGQPLTVTDANAHAWVEAFIPPYGWLVFDPTPWGPTLAPVTGTSSGGSSSLPAGGVGGDVAGAVGILGGPLAELLNGDVPGATGNVPIPRSLGLIPLAALVALIAAAAWSAYRQRWNPADPVGSAERLWAVMERVAARMGRPRTPAATPSEFGADLDHRWPGLGGAATAVAAAYGGLRWGPPTTRVAAAQRVRTAWAEVDRVWTTEAPVRHRLRRLL